MILILDEEMYKYEQSREEPPGTEYIQWQTSKKNERMKKKKSATNLSTGECDIVICKE